MDSPFLSEAEEAPQKTAAEEDAEEKKLQAQLSSVSVLGKRKATHLPIREDPAKKAKQATPAANSNPSVSEV